VDVGVGVVAALALYALRFSWFFIALLRCLCQATFLVLFIGFLPYYNYLDILFLSAAGGDGGGEVGTPHTPAGAAAPAPRIILRIRWRLRSRLR
jgi:hypothetical protein